MSLIFHRTDRGYESAGLAQPLLSFRFRQNVCSDWVYSNDAVSLVDFLYMAGLLPEASDFEQEFHVGINERIWLPVNFEGKPINKQIWIKLNPE